MPQVAPRAEHAGSLGAARGRGGADVHRTTVRGVAKDLTQEAPNPTVEDIEFEFRLKPSDDEHLEPYILAFDGEVNLWDDDVGRERVVGTISGHRIDLVSAMHDGLTQGEILECLTPEIADFADTVLQNSRCMLPSSEGDTLEQEPCDCLVYIARLWVEPQYRSQGMGSALLRRLAATIDTGDQTNSVP